MSVYAVNFEFYPIGEYNYLLSKIVLVAPPIRHPPTGGDEGGPHFEGTMLLALQHELKALGFKTCLKTRELRADGLEANVAIGIPLRWDIENGVYCIYDDYGHPWGIKDPGDGGLFKFKVQHLAQRFGLQRGCRVTHSYDSEMFFRRQISSQLPGVGV